MLALDGTVNSDGFEHRSTKDVWRGSAMDEAIEGLYFTEDKKHCGQIPEF